MRRSEVLLFRAKRKQEQENEKAPLSKMTYFRVKQWVFVLFSRFYRNQI